MMKGNTIKAGVAVVGTILAGVAVNEVFGQTTTADKNVNDLMAEKQRQLQSGQKQKPAETQTLVGKVDQNRQASGRRNAARLQAAQPRGFKISSTDSSYSLTVMPVTVYDATGSRVDASRRQFSVKVENPTGIDSNFVTYKMFSANDPQGRGNYSNANFQELIFFDKKNEKYFRQNSSGQLREMTKMPRIDNLVEITFMKDDAQKILFEKLKADSTGYNPGSSVYQGLPNAFIDRFHGLVTKAEKADSSMDASYSAAMSSTNPDTTKQRLNEGRGKQKERDDTFNAAYDSLKVLATELSATTSKAAVSDSLAIEKPDSLETTKVVEDTSETVVISQNGAFIISYGAGGGISELNRTKKVEKTDDAIGMSLHGNVSGGKPSGAGGSFNAGIKHSANKGMTHTRMPGDNAETLYGETKVKETEIQASGGYMHPFAKWLNAGVYGKMKFWNRSASREQQRIDGQGSVTNESHLKTIDVMAGPSWYSNIGGKWKLKMAAMFGKSYTVDNDVVAHGSGKAQSYQGGIGFNVTNGVDINLDGQFDNRSYTGREMGVKHQKQGLELAVPVKVTDGLTIAPSIEYQKNKMEYGGINVHDNVIRLKVGAHF